MSPVYALSFHATYRCGRSGVCCSSDWDIPVDLPLHRGLEAALASGRLAPAPEASGVAPFIVEADLPDNAAAMVARTESGHCVFYHRGSGLCVVHRDAGEDRLPPACRHFPRVAVRDRRGTFISLTHYCPTAAQLLFGSGPIEIVESPPAFPAADYEGLRVDDEAWPPLLHPRMLMDLEGYSAWERHMVARCSEPALSPEQVIGAIRQDAEALRSFTPDTGTLASAVAALPARRDAPSVDMTLEGSLRLHDEVLSAVPEDVRPEPDEDGLLEAFTALVMPNWFEWREPLRRYVAARAFANWTAYQGDGILAIVRGLEAALAFVRVEAARECRNAGRALDADLLTQAVRATDFVLNHIADSGDLAKRWSQVEQGTESRTPNPEPRTQNPEPGTPNRT